MKLIDINYKIKCDIPNCKNFASIKIEKTGFLKIAGLYLCKDCMNELYKELGSKLVPKSPENIFNKKVKGDSNAKKK